MILRAGDVIGSRRVVKVTTDRAYNRGKRFVHYEDIPTGKAKRALWSTFSKYVRSVEKGRRT